MSEYDKIAVCDRVLAMPCNWMTREACVAEMDGFVQEYEGDCCAGAVGALLKCGASNGFRCADLSDDILFSTACSGVEEAFDHCAGSHDNCTESVSPGKWLVECDQYSAECLYVDAIHECRCTFGPKTGVVFEAPADEVLPAVQAACK